MRFVNTTGQTLPTGTISVFGAGGFTGETSLDRLKPGERRFLQIGNDLDGGVTLEKELRREESKRVTLEGDHLSEHFLRTTDEVWTLENRGGSPRTFYVALAADKNAKVTGVDRVDFDEAASQPIVVFDVKSNERAKRSFTVVEGLSRALTLDDLTEKTLRALLQKTTIPASELATLQQALPRAQALEAARAQVTSAERAAGAAQGRPRTPPPRSRRARRRHRVRRRGDRRCAAREARRGSGGSRRRRARKQGRSREDPRRPTRCAPRGAREVGRSPHGLTTSPLESRFDCGQEPGRGGGSPGHRGPHRSLAASTFAASALADRGFAWPQRAITF